MNKNNLTPEQERIVKNWIRNADKISKDIKSTLAHDKYKNASNICKRAIDSYYAEYTPGSMGSKHPYHRTKSLYDAFTLGIKNGTEFNFELGSEFMEGHHHRVDDDYIYNVMFMEGWHGGATSGAGHPNPGTPYWKVAPAFTTWWDTSAPRSTAPGETITKRWNAYMDGKFKIDRTNAYTKAFSKYGK